MKKNSRVYAAIHLDALEQNLENMKKNLTPGTRMIGVIKANAYGHGAVPVAHLMEGKDYIWGYAVANVPEAEELRDAGLKKPILILGYVFPEDYQTLVKLDIRPAVFDYETAEKISQEAQKAGKVHPIHLAFDTGMTRIGFRHPKESLPEILRISKLPGITIEGAFTHFARADEQDLTSAHQQFANYQEFLTLLGRCQRGAAGQPPGVAAHDLHDRDRAGVIYTAVLGHFHAGGRYVLGGARKAGAVIGAEEVVVDRLGHAHHAAVPIVRLHIAADLVAGIHGVVAAVIEEVAHVVFPEDLQNTTVIRIVRVRVCHFVAAGAQLRRRRVQQQAELVRILLSDIIQAVIQNAADAMGRTVNVGNGIGFQRSLEHSVGAGIDDCSRPAGLPKDTRAF